MDNITKALEDNRSAVVLTSVDFSKAFNRLEHGSCLRAFTKKGASTQVIKLLAGFMCGRMMTVKVGTKRSVPRPVNAGAPQGSVLGCYLFNVGVDDIEEDCPYDGRVTHQETLSSDFPAVSTPTRVNRSIGNPDLSPVREQNERDQDVEFLPTAVNIPPWMRKPKDPHWRPTEPSSLKFVDDSIHFSVINMRAEPLMIHGGKLIKTTSAPEAQAMLEHIIKRAEERGMVVNDDKTGVMCVSGATSFEAGVKLRARNGEVAGSSTMKCLGVTIDNDCSFKTHVSNLAAKIRSKTWTLTKLKRFGMDQSDLKKVYTSLIRPVAEYASVVWHPMLTDEQARSIERQQNQAMKNIVGIGVSANKMRHALALESLSERREKAVSNFAIKCSKNGRFAHWFKCKNDRSYSKRAGVAYQKYVEPRYRTDRHMNSPLNYMIRKLNQASE